MKTLYTKFTRERKPEFQQITKIYVENGNQKVSKAALDVKGQAHINHMYENYQYFQSKEKSILCPTKLKNGKILFDYLTGKSLCDQLLECIHDGRRDDFIKLLYAYKQFVFDFGDEKELFIPTNEFKQVFGDVSLDQNIGARHLNIDLVFENLIEQGNRFMSIDYEWIFDFTIPYGFVFYRAIYSFILRYSKDIEGFIEADTLYDLFGISKKDIEIFKEMDINFLSYVYGREYNYDLILLRYRKEAYRAKEIIEKHMKTSLSAQLYYDTGNGFNSQQCINKTIYVSENDRIEIEFELSDGVNSVRFDPSLNAIMIYLDCIIGIKEDSQQSIIEQYSSNADNEIGKYRIFKQNDPQIIINGLNEFKKIKFIMRYVTEDIFLMDEKLDHKLLKGEYEKELKENECLKKANDRLQKINNIYLNMIEELRKR